MGLELFAIFHTHRAIVNQRFWLTAEDWPFTRLIGLKGGQSEMFFVSELERDSALNVDIIVYAN